jgi:hypothetical protein
MPPCPKKKKRKEGILEDMSQWALGCSIEGVWELGRVERALWERAKNDEAFFFYD